MCRIPSSPGTEHLGPPTISQRVSETFRSRDVKCFDFGCGSFLTLIGAAVTAFAVALLVLSLQSNGWMLDMLPPYALLGVVACVGTVLTAIAIKRMVDACHKMQQFQADINEVTGR